MCCNFLVCSARTHTLRTLSLFLLFSCSLSCPLNARCLALPLKTDKKNHRKNATLLRFSLRFLADFPIGHSNRPYTLYRKKRFFFEQKQNFTKKKSRTNFSKKISDVLFRLGRGVVAIYCPPRATGIEEDVLSLRLLAVVVRLLRFECFILLMPFFCCCPLKRRKSSGWLSSSRGRPVECFLQHRDYTVFGASLLSVHISSVTKHARATRGNARVRERERNEG